MRTSKLFFTQKEEVLPLEHTCLNQLVLPSNSTVEKVGAVGIGIPKDFLISFDIII